MFLIVTILRHLTLLFKHTFIYGQYECVCICIDLNMYIVSVYVYQSANFVNIRLLRIHVLFSRLHSHIVQ